MNVFVSSKGISARVLHDCTNFSDFIFLAVILVRFFLISILLSLLLVPENSALSQFSVAHFHVPFCSFFFFFWEFIFKNRPRLFVISVIKCVCMCCCCCIWNPRRYFIHKKIEKETRQQTESPFVHCRWTCIELIFSFVTFDGLKNLNRMWLQQSFFIFHLVWSLVNWLFTLFTYIDSSWSIIKSDKCKGLFQSERPYNSESVTENTLCCICKSIQGSLFCYEDQLFQILFKSRYTIHTNQYLLYRLDTFLNTEIHYNKNSATYTNNWLQ